MVTTERGIYMEVYDIAGRTIGMYFYKTVKEAEEDAKSIYKRTGNNSQIFKRIPGTKEYKLIKTIPEQRSKEKSKKARRDYLW